MIWLYIYLISCAVSLIGILLSTTYIGYILVKRGVKKLRKPTAFDYLVSFVRLIFVSIIPIINILTFLGLIFCSDEMADKAEESISRDNEEYLNGQDG